MSDLISRQAAIDALWKALYEYEDKTEKQFQESEDLDVGDWIEHRIFVQNMNDIDRQTILNLPSAQPERKTEDFEKGLHDMFDYIWDCEIRRPVFQDTVGVGELMQEVIQLYRRVVQPCEAGEINAAEERRK